MADRRALILDLVNEIIAKAEELNEQFLDGDEDTAEDLSDAELETLLDQIQEKSNRPRRPLPTI